MILRIPANYLSLGKTGLSHIKVHNKQTNSRAQKLGDNPGKPETEPTAEESTTQLDINLSFGRVSVC